MGLLGYVVIQEDCGRNSVKILPSSTGRTGMDIRVVPWGAQMAWPLYLCCCCMRAASGRHVLLGNMSAAQTNMEGADCRGTYNFTLKWEIWWYCLDFPQQGSMWSTQQSIIIGLIVFSTPKTSRCGTVLQSLSPIPNLQCSGAFEQKGKKE